MPEMDGIEVCKQVKSNPLTEEIPIIFLTAKTDTESLVEAFDVGAVDYITKPVNKMELLARVKNQLQLQAAKDELREQVDVLMDNARLQADIDRMVHHDLKTPISAIINLSEQLIEHPKYKILPEDFNENIQLIESSGYLLMDLVNQSLNIYKIEMDKYQANLKAIDIKSLISRVADDININAEKNQINIQCLYDESKVFALIDELLCYSIFSNLIKNAVEASEAGHYVKIDLKVVDDEVVIKIHNVKAVPEQIIDTFFNKNVTFGKQEGNGLGTYSAKIMTEVQGGTIEMQSDDTTGTFLILSFKHQEGPE